MQDDPKHTSRLVKGFFDSNVVNWWRTPPESPNANPIENLWHEPKEFVRREVKPKKKKKAELVEGIKRFWLTVDATKGGTIPFFPKLAYIFLYLSYLFPPFFCANNYYTSLLLIVCALR